MAVFALAACTGLAYVRYQSGADMSQFMTEEQLAQEQAQYYDSAGNYQNSQIPDNGADYNAAYVDPMQYTSGTYTSYGFDNNQTNMNN